jgi:ribosomal protein S25
MLAGYAGYEEDLKLIPTEPIGIELSETILLQIAPKEWLLEKAGIDMTKYQSAPEVNPVELSEQFNFADLDGFGDSKESFHIWKQKEHFADVELFADVTQLQSNVLDLITKDKRITPEVIADTLKEDVGVVKRILTDLEKKGFISSKITTIGEGYDESEIIERKLTAPISEIVEKIKPSTTEFLIRYSYEWRQGFNDSDLSTSRQFCKYFKTTNKLYSRSEIEAMSARLGYDVFTRGGGWYTLPGTNNHRNFCRHLWKSNIVTRK